MNKAFEKILERLEEELKLADEVKEKCARENPLMFDNAKGYSTGIANAKYIVQKVAAEYNGGWIPCSEMLPEENIEVLVSVSEIDDGIYTRTSWLQDGIWVIKKTTLHPTVVAWQPLPEPYKERE